MKFMSSLRSLLALTALVLLSSACSPIKETITIETNGGHKKELDIEVPRKFSNRKDQYVKAYAMSYMNYWNNGVSLIPVENSEYSFTVRLFDKNTSPRFVDDDVIEAVSTHFDKHDLRRKVTIEGEDFKDDQMRIKREAYLESQENKPSNPQRGFWPSFPNRQKEGESSE